MRPCFVAARAVLVASLLLPATSALAQGRMRPPAQLHCDRSQLTSYFGKVTGYKRMKSSVWLRIATDYGTVEEVTVRDPMELDPARHFLYQGRAFTAADWARIERKPGKLRAGTRATAWVCGDGGTPLVDWNGAAE